MESFAEEGLRTLCIAFRVMTDEEYLPWAERYNEASSSLMDRDIKMDALADEVERRFILLGSTAIEDKLQEGVTISILIPFTVRFLNALKSWAEQESKSGY